jgi:hypothetical protein
VRGAEGGYLSPDLRRLPIRGAHVGRPQQTPPLVVTARQAPEAGTGVGAISFAPATRYAALKARILAPWRNSSR